MRSTLAILAVLLVLQCSHSGALAMSWQSGKGVSCKTSCATNGGGFDSGIFNGDSDKVFYVCAANAGQGSRPGYNLKRLEPTGASSATVAEKSPSELTIASVGIEMRHRERS
jgi:hypothetical protein